MSEVITATLNLTQIEGYSKRASRNLTAYLYDVADDVQTAFKRVFFDTTQLLGNNAGLPVEYIDHIANRGASIPLDIVISANTLTANYDFSEMGDWEDLSLAFHRHARLADGDRVEGPWEGGYDDSELKYPKWKRLLDWETKINQPESWKEKVEIWESIGLAPEWLLLNFGQEYPPATPAMPFIETINKRLQVLVAGYMAYAVGRATETNFQKPIISYTGEVFRSQSEKASAQVRLSSGIFGFGYKSQAGYVGRPVSTYRSEYDFEEEYY